MSGQKTVSVKIEKGIPLPDARNVKRNPMIAVLEKMKDGDSFLYPNNGSKRSKLSYCSRKAKVVIATRTVDETTMRVWRIKAYSSTLTDGERTIHCKVRKP